MSNDRNISTFVAALQYCTLPVIVVLFVSIFYLLERSPSVLHSLGSTLAAFGVGSMLNLLHSRDFFRFSATTETTSATKEGKVSFELPYTTDERNLRVAICVLIFGVGIAVWVGTMLLPNKGFTILANIGGLLYFIVAGFVYVSEAKH